MRRSVRYPIALAVALALPLVLYVADAVGGHPLLLVAVAVVYGPTTSLVLAHPDAWWGTATPRSLGAVGGGVGAFAGTSLLQVSVPVGVVGLGLFLFGGAVARAETAAVD